MLVKGLERALTGGRGDVEREGSLSLVSSFRDTSNLKEHKTETPVRQRPSWEPRSGHHLIKAPKNI